MNSQQNIEHSSGYPPIDRVLQGCATIVATEPKDVFITCIAQLHNLSERKTAALLQVFKINTLAANCILRDIAQRKPEHRFTAHRKQQSTKYFTVGIANQIDKEYREKIRSRYTLNSYLFDGLCTTIGSMVSSYLQKITDAREKGFVQQYEQSANYVVGFGRHKGNVLKMLGRKTIYGYAFLMPKREQCEHALNNISVVLANDRQNSEWNNAVKYKLTFGPRRNRPLGSLRNDTLQRLKLLVQRELQRTDQTDELREVAQSYLRFTPPRFPTIQTDGLTPSRKHELNQEYINALDDFADLPNADDEIALLNNLTRQEHQLFINLQQRAYAAASQLRYMPLRWGRPDACTRHRECGLLYDPVKRRYLFLAYLLDKSSRHKRPVIVKGNLHDVNNPTKKLELGQRPSPAMLFELEFDTHQQRQLEEARRQAYLWKDKPDSSSGCVRAATLHALYSKEELSWRFEVHLSLGFKPSKIKELKHVIGLHIDPFDGWYIMVLGLDGSFVAQYHLDEYTIALWLRNKNLDQQAQLKPNQRTAKERQHRIADVIVAIAHQYQAQLGVENIKYRVRTSTLLDKSIGENSVSTTLNYLPYKLALAGLPAVIDVKGVSPKRSCGYCGTLHTESRIENGIFTCKACQHSEKRHANSAREIARRTLWILAWKCSPPHNLSN